MNSLLKINTVLTFLMNFQHSSYTNYMQQLHTVEAMSMHLCARLYLITLYTHLCAFNVHGSVHLGNVYIQLKVQDAHGFVFILYFTTFALHVSGAIYTHHQEHKLQSTAVGMRDLWMTKVLNSIKWFRVIWLFA
jgi:hypothetical protein